MPVGHSVAINAGFALTLDDRSLLEAVGLLAILAAIVGVRGGGLSKTLRAERAGKRFEENSNLERAAAMAALALLLVSADGDNFVGLEHCVGHVVSPC